MGCSILEPELNNRLLENNAMKALVWKGPSMMEIEESPRPEVRPGWVLIQVEDSGICGSEIGAFLGHNELRRPPLIMGHEFSGTIVELGAGVPQEWEGRLVTVNPLVTCGQCRMCRLGQRQLCAFRKIIGVDYPGSYANYVSVPFTACHIIKNPVLGALVEPLACAVRATSLAQVEVGDSVMVIGAGTIGLMAARLIEDRGASRCVVVDTNPARLHWASNWGATSVLDPKTDDVASFVKDSTSGEGMDSVVDAVGLGATRAQGLACVRRGGRVVLIGLHENMTTIPGNEIVRFEKQIIGSFSYSDEDFRRAVLLADNGFIETSSGWLDIRGLESGPASFEEQAGGLAKHSKVLLRSMV
jgi:2-desacetyl-2-hydroxyethyl bacteriochlorophyllide A dehydrogenase